MIHHGLVFSHSFDQSMKFPTSLIDFSGTQYQLEIKYNNTKKDESN